MQNIADSGNVISDNKFLSGFGEVATYLRNYDWPATTLGRPNIWPQSLRTAINMLLSSPLPSWLVWGSNNTLFFNDALLMEKGRDYRLHRITHLGMPAHEAWPENWHLVAPQIEQVRRTGEAVLLKSQVPQNTENVGGINGWEQYTCSPIWNEEGNIGGVLATRCLRTPNEIDYQSATEPGNHQASEAQFYSFAENLPDVISRHDRSFRYIYANPQIEAYTGKKPDELIGKTFQEVGFPDESVRFFEEHLSFVFKTGKLHTVEFPNPVGRGYLFARLMPELDAQGHVASVVIVNTDITERKNAEKTHHEVKERLQAALNASLTGTFRWNIVTDELMWDENLDRLFGLPPGETVQNLQNFIEQVHPEDKQSVIDRCKRCATEGADFNLEFRVVWPDGSLHWLHDKGQTIIDENGQPLYMTGACVDITEHKQAQEAIRLNEQRFEAAVNAVQGVLWTNNAAGEMVGEQPGWATLTGQSYEDYQGYGWSKVVHPDDAQPTIDAWNDAVRERKTFVFEHRVKKSDGTWGVFSIRAIPLLHADGTIREWVGVHTDITEQRKAEQGLVESTELLRLFIGHAPAAIAMFDVDMKYLAVSQRWMNDYNLSGNIIGQSHYAILPDMPQYWKDIHQRALNGLVEKSDDDRFDREDGTTLWLKWEVRPWHKSEGKVGGIVVFSEDITTQKKTEKALAYQRQLLETVTENTDMALFLMDDRQFCVYMNEAAEQMTGFTLDELKGKQLHYYVHHTHPDGRHYPLEECPIDQALPTQKRMKGEEVFLHKDGSFYPVAFTASPIVVEGKPTGTVIEVRNTTEEKRKTQELQESESRFRHLIESNIIGVLFWDMDGGILDANDSFLHMLGYTQEDLRKGLDWRAMTPPQWTEADRKGEEQVLATGRHLPFEKQYLHKNGTPVDVILGSSAFRDTGNRQGVTFVLDISEHKRAEKQVYESESRFRTLVEEAPVATCLFVGRELRIEIANEKIIAIMGKGRSVMGKPLAEAVPELEGQPFLEQLDWVFTTGETFENRNARAELVIAGEERVFYFDYIFKPLKNAEGEVYAILDMTIDVTDHVLARKALEESKEQLKQLSDFMPQIVWATKADGYHDFFNQRWYDFTGLTYEETKATGWATVLHPDDHERTWQVWNHSLQTGDLYEIEYRMRRWDGQYRWLLARAMPFRNNEGEIVRWFGTCTDIHDQKTIEEQLETLVAERTRELQRSNEDLQQFAHVASHDLKEPVRKVMTFSSRLRQELGNNLSENATMCLSRIEGASLRMYSMIDGVLLYSSLEALEQTKELINLADLMESIKNDLEVPFAEKGATLTYSNLPAIEGSAILIYQLFYNLINNSLKFGRADVPPVIELTARATTVEEVNKAGLTAKKDYVTLALADNGIGFVEEESQRIFGTFTRLHSKDKYEGTGLGLSLCKKIVERHGGSIWAKGEPGKGATFFMLLPT